MKFKKMFKAVGASLLIACLVPAAAFAGEDVTENAVEKEVGQELNILDSVTKPDGAFTRVDEAEQDFKPENAPITKDVENAVFYNGDGTAVYSIADRREDVTAKYEELAGTVNSLSLEKGDVDLINGYDAPTDTAAKFPVYTPNGDGTFDKTWHIVPIKVTYTPQIEKIEVTYKTTEPIDYLSAVKNMPNGARLEITEPADVNKPGRQVAKGKIFFKNGLKSIDVEIPVSVVIKWAPIEEFPAITTATVNVMKDAEADYSNAVTNLPEGARVEVYEKADTSTVGLKDAKVKVILANGMSKVVTVKVMVHQPMIGLEEIPEVKTTTVYAVQGTPCDITKGVTLPEGATAEVVEDVATTEKGDFVGKVKVIFKNGMTRTVKVSVKVVKEVPWGTIEAIPTVTPVPHNYTIGDITLEEFAKLDDHEFFKTDGKIKVLDILSIQDAEGKDVGIDKVDFSKEFEITITYKLTFENGMSRTVKVPVTNKAKVVTQPQNNGTATTQNGGNTAAQNTQNSGVVANSNIPNTGDSNPLYICVGAGALALMGMVVVTIMRKRKANK
jgi:putative surface protein